MIDSTCISTWLLPSCFIRQIDIAGAEEHDTIAQLIKIAIAAFSILLLGLSLTAFRKTGLKSIIYATIAFGLFAVQLLIDYLEDVVLGWQHPFNDIILYSMTLAILVLFFMAIVKRK